MSDTASRRIVSSFFISLDGVVESPDEWHFPYFDDDMGAAVSAGFAGSDAMLMGATLYREWAEYWPASDDEFATTINGTRKYVVSDSLTGAEWANSTVIRRAEAVERLHELRDGPGQDIAMSGSATLVRWLLREGLVDELNLLVHPVVVGAGQRLFDGSHGPLRLTLASATPFASGVLHLVYRPEPGDEPAARSTTCVDQDARRPARPIRGEG